MRYRAREPGKTGGIECPDIETGIAACKEWFENTGIKCVLEYEGPFSHEWAQSTYIADFVLPLDMDAFVKAFTNAR